MAKRSKGLFALVWLAVLALAGPAVVSAGMDRTPLPQADRPGSADDPLLGRYSGSVILIYEARSLGDAELPLGKLEPVPNVADAMRATVKKTVEGRRTHFLYYAGKEASPLEIVRSYQDEIKSQGGRVVFECREAACGGKPTNNFFQGGGVINYLYPLSLHDAGKLYKSGSPEHCAMIVSMTELQLTTLELPGNSGFAVIAAYRGGDTSYDCAKYTGATFASVDLVDTSPRKSRMVNVNAAEIARALQGSGKIALYGIYFDVDKADVKPESNATLAEIAKLMKEKPGLKLIVAGHTDNTGTFDANIDLSQRRAASVVGELSKRYGVKADRLRPLGVSSAAPVAPNKTEEGRAKNRRVELVEQ